MGTKEEDISQAEAKAIGDDIIAQRLRKIAGEGDIIVNNGQVTKGVGDGEEIPEVIDPESAKIMGGGLGLGAFKRGSGTKSETPEQKPIERATIKPVNAAEVSGVGLNNKVQEDKDTNEDATTKIAYADREDEEKTVKDVKETATQAMERLGMSKDVAIDWIFQLSDKGYVEEKFVEFSGRISAVFRAQDVGDSAEFIELMDDEDMTSPARIAFFLNLYSVAIILHSYNGEPVGGWMEKDKASSLQKRAEWVKENIPTAIFSILLKKAKDFHQKMDLLASPEVADFF